MALTTEQRAQRQEWLNELEEARASGATRIRYRDRDVTFRSLDELDRLLDRLQRRLRFMAQTDFGQGFTRHQACGDPCQRLACGLGNERHRA